MLNTPSHMNMLCMAMNFQVQGTHPYCVDAVVICKHTSLEDSLEKALRSIYYSMDAVRHCKILRGLLFGTIPILMRYHMSFSTALLSRLQLWHYYWLVSIQSLSNLNSQVR